MPELITEEQIKVFIDNEEIEVSNVHISGLWNKDKERMSEPLSPSGSFTFHTRYNEECHKRIVDYFFSNTNYLQWVMNQWWLNRVRT